MSARSGLPRAADVVVAALGLALTAPFLLLVMTTIRLDSRGPAIYRQKRVGRGGVEFGRYKLRTMVEGAERVGIGTAVAADDPRAAAAPPALGSRGVPQTPRSSPKCPPAAPARCS